jgi:hypothetical protein
LLIESFPTILKAHLNSSKKISFDLNLMFNEKIIRYAIIVTLWVQTLGNQGNTPYSSIGFWRYQECSSKHVGFISRFSKIPRVQFKTCWFQRSRCHKANKTSLLNNIDRWKKDNICQTIWDKSEVLLGMC